MTSAVADPQLIHVNAELDALRPKIDAKDREVKDAAAKVEAAAPVDKDFAIENYRNLVAQLKSLNEEKTMLLTERATLSAGPVFITGALWNKTKLFSQWRQLGALHRAMRSWEAQEVAGMGQMFMEFWGAHGEQLKSLKLTTQLCIAEPNDACYTAAHTILTRIYQCMVETCLGAEAWSQDVKRLVFKAINQSNMQLHSSGAPDMAWGVLSESVTRERGRGLEWKDHAKVIHELKADEVDLDDGVAQVVDRGDTIRHQRPGQQSILLGASSTGAVLRSLVVVHNPDGSLHALYQTETLRLTAAITSSSYPATMSVDTRSHAFQELVWQVYFTAGQHLRAAAEPADELLPGDIVSVSVAGSGDEGHSSSGSASFRITCRLSHDACKTGATYAATALDTPGYQQAVVLKIGPNPADRQLALHLRLSWPPWYQVERELAVRRAAMANGGFRNMPPLVAGGRVVQCRRPGGEAVAPRLTGAAVVATQLQGRALVRQGLLPVLPAQEVVALQECLTLTVQDLQAHGVHHNDINPRNIGELRSPDGILQAFYLYDMGAAAAAPVTEMLRHEPPHIRMEALLYKDKSWVSDLEFGSNAAVAGSRLQPESDLESLLFCCIRLLGHALPWSEAAASGDRKEVLHLREATAKDPSSLPGFTSYPAPLQAFAAAVLSGGAAGAASSQGQGTLNILQQPVLAQ